MKNTEYELNITTEKEPQFLEKINERKLKEVLKEFLVMLLGIYILCFSLIPIIYLIAYLIPEAQCK
ncbi:MAG TPA: hypothetical protein PL131_09500 [Methylotenera sp.]|nr:hypothetical protein [Methylotenera sp.]HPH06097.1 hypothetical protein [Methylotenera sp.]